MLSPRNSTISAFFYSDARRPPREGYGCARTATLLFFQRNLNVNPSQQQLSLVWLPTAPRGGTACTTGSGRAFLEGAAWAVPRSNTTGTRNPAPVAQENIPGGARDSSRIILATDTSCS